MKKLLFTTLAITVLSSCNKTGNFLPDNTSVYEGISNNMLQDSVYKGTKVRVFGGKAWVSVKLDSSGKPKQLVLTLTNAVFETVPFDSSEVENEIVIPAPPQASITSFMDFAIDWSSQGHEPDSIYGLPLFDFHFYLISEAERQAIFTDSNYDQHFSSYPSMEYLPRHSGLVNAGGIPGGGCITGTHWYDLRSQEFNGQTFTQTFVYGTYNGKVDFYDPMMTLQFLQSVQTFERDIPQPAKFTPNGYYPTKLKVVKHDNNTDIILEGFRLRPAS